MAETSMGMSQTDVASLKEALCSQQLLLSKLYNELDVERESSATAASEALSMILRLQGEKAAMKMEAEQYKRLAEEKINHAEEAMAIFEDLIFQKEMLITSLDYQVQAYRYKLMSLGYTDPSGNGDTKFPDCFLQRNEAFSMDISPHNLARRNSAPPKALESYLKVVIERDRSPSLDNLLPEIEEIHSDTEMDGESSDFEDKPNSDINSFWEQIRKLDQRVKEIKEYNYANLIGESKLCPLPQQARAGISSDPAKATAKENGGVKKEKSLLENEALDSACSLQVHDVYEVPQIHEKHKVCKQKIKDEGVFAMKGDERPRKLDSFPLEHVKSSITEETDRMKKKVFLSTQQQHNICIPSDEIAVDCNFALVRHKIGFSEPQAKVQTGIESQVERREAIDPGRRESIHDQKEELKLLNEIKNQLNLIQSELRSMKTKKSSHGDGLSMLSLQEAMLHFWL